MRNRSPLFAPLLSSVLLLASASSDADATTRQATAENGKRLVLAMVEAINARDLEALDELVAADLRRHSDATPGVVVTSREQFRAFLEADLAAVPDSVQTVHSILAEGDLVAVRATYAGTQTGPFGPFPASGRRVELTFLAILRIENERIAEIWVEWDNLSMLSQLGHLTVPGSTPED